jgi:phage terminase large subunit-like protein
MLTAEDHAILAEAERRAAYPLRTYSWDAYPKHRAYMRAGADHRERLFIAANRVGKTQVAAYELALHLTGRYDEYAPWWDGRRFDGPIKAWAAGDTGKTTRDILQASLVGPPGQSGAGMIPAHLVTRTTAKAGLPDALEAVYVQHVSGGTSILQLKSYDQRREAFQGTAQDVIWLDEEPPEDIYTECLLRTMTTGGVVQLTFTPLMGLTPLVLSFLPGGQAMEGRSEANPSRFLVSATWDDAPHLTPAMREELWASIPPYQRDARAKGIPQLGSGAIYQVSEDDVSVADFAVPTHWPRAFGMDTGWDWTAAVWGAWNRETDTVYIYSAYKRGQAEPPVHAQAIRARGDWIPGVGDAAAINLYDGRAFIDIYRQLGLNVELPDKAVEAGLQKVWERLSAGKLKAFRSCGPWFEEYRLYRRDEKGKVVKANDHLMDATRYLVVSGLYRATVQKPASNGPPPLPPMGGGGWMA